MTVEENGIEFLQELSTNLKHLLVFIQTRLEEPTEVDARAIVVAGVVFQKLDSCHGMALNNMRSIANDARQSLELLDEEDVDDEDVQQISDEIDSIMEEDDDDTDDEPEV